MFVFDPMLNCLGFVLDFGNVSQLVLKKKLMIVDVVGTVVVAVAAVLENEPVETVETFVTSAVAVFGQGADGEFVVDVAVVDLLQTD